MVDGGACRDVEASAAGVRGRLFRLRTVRGGEAAALGSSSLLRSNHAFSVARLRAACTHTQTAHPTITTSNNSRSSASSSSRAPLEGTDPGTGSGLPGAIDDAFTPTTTADAPPTKGDHIVIVSLSTATFVLIAANRETMLPRDDAAGSKGGAVPYAASVVEDSAALSGGACTSNCAVIDPRLDGANTRLPGATARRPSPSPHARVRSAALSSLSDSVFRNDDASPSHASEA